MTYFVVVFASFVIQVLFSDSAFVYGFPNVKKVNINSIGLLVTVRPPGAIEDVILPNSLFTSHLSVLVLPADCQIINPEGFVPPVLGSVLIGALPSAVAAELLFGFGLASNVFFDGFLRIGYDFDFNGVRITPRFESEVIDVQVGQTYITRGEAEVMYQPPPGSTSEVPQPQPGQLTVTISFSIECAPNYIGSRCEICAFSPISICCNPGIEFSPTLCTRVHPPFCNDGDIRIVNSNLTVLSRTQQGRVELCVDRNWGRVCDDTWGINDAAVACPVNLAFRGLCGPDERITVLNEVECVGSETSLLQCPHNEVDIPHNCGDDAGAFCTDVISCGDARAAEICSLLPNSRCMIRSNILSCECLPGFERVNVHASVVQQECRDINECAPGAENNCDDNAKCTNTIGSHTCTCLPGYDGDGTTCFDVNECTCKRDNGSPLTAEKSSCTDQPPDVCCRVDSEPPTTRLRRRAVETPAGGEAEWTLVSLACTDIFNSHCTNTPGSFRCDCNRGYLPVCTVIGSFSQIGGTYPSPDTYTCEDINECQQSSDVCAVLPHSMCQNTPGAFICPCQPGFRQSNVTFPVPGTELRNFECLDINECATGDNNCNANAFCNNTIGNYTCTCANGYIGDGFECFDFDECLHAEMGMQNACDQHLVSNAHCDNRIGTFLCPCNPGYERTNVTDPQPGMMFDYNCTDINECFTLAKPCAENAVCFNSIGGYNCQCVRGYRGDGFKVCTDFDECLKKNPMDLGVCDYHGFDVNTAQCINEVGSFDCLCLPGYDRMNITDPRLGSMFNYTCVDRDECVLDHPCDMNANCTNFDGGFNCTCLDGFRGDGLCCSDINECLEAERVGGNQCVLAHVPNANCTNLMGSYDCVCRKGYEQSPRAPTDEISRFKYTCTDIDECKAPVFPCDKNALCTNYDGGFSCACQRGYTGDGISCANINECLVAYLAGMDACVNASVPNAKCVDRVGFFECMCLPGYRRTDLPIGMNTTFDYRCLDIDECTDPSVEYPCDVHAMCTNTMGGVNCTCLPGYTGDGDLGSCSDIDECSVAASELQNACVNVGVYNARCRNQPGTFSCPCLRGYEQTVLPGPPGPFNYNCTDINECVTGTAQCNENAICTNTMGSYDCACITAYIGDGFFCTPLQCPNLEPPPNGEFAIYNNVLLEQSAVGVLHCQDGHVAQGPTLIVFCEEAIWIETLPTCVLASSAEFPSPVDQSLRITAVRNVDADDELVGTTPGLFSSLAAILEGAARNVLLNDAGKKRKRRQSPDEIELSIGAYNCSGTVLSSTGGTCNIIVIFDGVLLTREQLITIVAAVEAAAQAVGFTLSVPSNTTSQTAGSSDSSDLTAGGIVGIVIGAVIVEWILLALVVGLCIRFGRNRMMVSPNKNGNTVTTNRGASSFALS